MNECMRFTYIYILVVLGLREGCGGEACLVIWLLVFAGQVSKHAPYTHRSIRQFDWDKQEQIKVSVVLGIARGA